MSEHLNHSERPKFNISLQELIIIGTAIVSITASVLFVRADVMVLKTEVESLKALVSKVETRQSKANDDQEKIKDMVSSLYREKFWDHGHIPTQQNQRFNTNKE